MDQLVERFLKKVGVKDLSPFFATYFELLVPEKKVNRILATLHCPNLLSCTAYQALFTALNKTDKDFETRLSFAYDDDTACLDDFVDSYIAENDAYDLGDYQFDKATKTLVISYTNPQLQAQITKETNQLSAFFQKISCAIQVALREKVTDPLLTGDQESALPNEAPLPAETDPLAQREQSKKLAAELAKKLETERVQNLKDGSSYYPALLKDIDKLQRVLVTGKIFKRDQRTTKKGKPFLIFEYTDDTNSIQSLVFENKKFTADFMNKLQVGTKIKVKGEVSNDAFSHQLIIAPTKIEILPPDPPRTDEETTKRVELHLHTNMSAMDGIASISKYAQLAQQFHMDALGITDHGVVQAFPEAQKVAQKYGLKMLYGCELYMVDSHLDIAINTQDIALNDADYVVFDLETTGLSARYDRIIEFGATKYSRGQQTDKIDFFINPDRKLREIIINKTNITQAMVDGGRPIKEALKTILEYFGNAIIIDHNAGFDIGFLNEALKNNNLPKITNPIIDTLPLSRYMFPKQRSHTLEAIARTLTIPYDETKVHRAIYDAEILEAVYLGMLALLTEKKPQIKMQDLVDLTSDDVVLTARPKHIIAYAKNAQGLKDLYQLISLSSTKYLAAVPHTPRALVEEYRQNLLIGSACFNGEVFDSALTKSEDVLKQVMAWYDYIEVQPPACYSWLVNDGQVSSAEDLQKVLKDLITAAKDLNKPVVATGDVHYVNPEDKIYRDVYIFAKGLKGVQHPLNPYRRKLQKPYPNPDQHFRSTTEMKDAFAFLNNPALVEEIVVTNTRTLAASIDELKPTKSKLYTPYIENCDTNLTSLVFETAKALYGDPLPEIIQTRLDTELNGIKANGYYVIYWIASVLVRQVTQAGHLVGSRGSVGSSLVATMAGITEVNPLPPHYRCPQCKHLIWADVKTCADGFDLPDKNCPHCQTPMVKDGHNIPFETFLGFHADKVPDIDLNFPSDFQAQAHEMTRELLGVANVYKAGTIQTTEEKNAIGYVKGYFEAMDIDVKDIRPAEIDRLASGCVGVKRTTGQHPGGIIVIPADMSVYDFTPFQYPANSEDASWRTTHYDFHAIHDNVLKFDELGHVDPYAIKMMCAMADLDWKKIPFDDADTLSLFWSPKALKLHKNVLRQTTGALGLPEFGTNLARRILDETKPRSFSDLVRISGLSHGTNVFTGNSEELILNNQATLRDIICCRDDIMIDLNQKWGVPADEAFAIMEMVRKGQFTKPGFETNSQKALKTLTQYHAPQAYIDSCAKIQYLFPKGHACAYVMMAVRVAWFKMHRPEIYYAVYYTLRCNAYNLPIMQKGQQEALTWLNDYRRRKAERLPVENKENDIADTLTTYVEMTDRGIKFGHFSVTKSDATQFIVDPQTKEIIPPFAAIDSLGASQAQKIIDERRLKNFESVEDFEKRCRVSGTIGQTIRNLGGYGGLPESAQMTLDEFF